MSGPELRGGRVPTYGLVACALAVFAVDLFLYYRTFDYLAYGVSYIDNLIGLDAGGIARQLAGLTYYPPLYYAWIAAGYGLFGANFTAMAGMNLVFIAIGAVYLTALARRLEMGTLAFLPAVVMLLLPGTALAARQLTIEAPLVALVPAALYHVFASRGLTVRRHAALAGIVLGLAMLTKWTAPAYLAAGLVWFGIDGARRGPEKHAASADRVRNAAIGGAVALAVCGWWYAFRMDWSTFFASAANDPNYVHGGYGRMLADYGLHLGRLLGCWQATTGEWAEYFAAVLEDPLRTQQGIAAAIGAHAGMLPERIGPGWGLWLAGLSALALLVSQRRRKTLAAWAALVACPILILALPVHGEERYLYPLMPLAALALAYPAAFARRPAVRAALAAAIVAAVIIGHFRFLEAESVRPRHRREAAVGVRTETDLIVRYIAAQTLRTDKPETSVAVHPIWHNVHSTCDFLVYQADRRDLTGTVDVGCLSPFDYMTFRERLRAGVYDVVVTDCGPANDCLATDPEWVQAIVSAMAAAGYISQMKGTRSEPFSVGDMAEDAAYMAAHYRTALYLPLADGTFTRILVRRDDGPAGSEAP